MFQIISFIFLIIAAILPFVIDPAWSWLFVALLDAFIIIQFIFVKQRFRFDNIGELSIEANFLLSKYGHYYAMPFGSKDFSASAATSQFAGILIAAICAFKGFWWGIGFAVLNWVVMGFVASSLSPVSLLNKRPDLHSAHDEAVEFINSQCR